MIDFYHAKIKAVYGLRFLALRRCSGEQARSPVYGLLRSEGAQASKLVVLFIVFIRAARRPLSIRATVSI